ncbi:Hypothetical protein ABZS17G119_00826 [Kosakonia cowanii]
MKYSYWKSLKHVTYTYQHNLLTQFRQYKQIIPMVINPLAHGKKVRDHRRPTDEDKYERI